MALCLCSTPSIRSCITLVSPTFSIGRGKSRRPSAGTERARSLVSETYDRGIEQECQSAFVKPFLTVLLAGLDARNPNSEYEKWFEALGQTEQFLRHTLSCLPTDGNLWVRYAMVRQASAEQAMKSIGWSVFLKDILQPRENAITARYFPL